MSLKVKDMMRTLANEILDERLISDLYREGEGIAGPRKTKTAGGGISHFTSEFDKCVEHNEIDFEFLSQVYVEHQYLKCWCDDYNIPFPQFWLSWLDDDQISNLDIPGKNISTSPEQNKSRHRQEQDDKSERHQKAALVRHGPAADLKRDFVSYWNSHTELEPKLSRVQAAKRFISEQGDDRIRKAGLKKSNAENTLIIALRNYENGPEQTWMQKLRDRIEGHA